MHLRAALPELGPLEERLLETLWQRGNATVRELQQDGYQDLAYTTVMTTLDRLFKKNLLSRVAEGRAFRYSPRLSREEFQREVTAAAFQRWFNASSPSSLPLSYLVEIVSARDARLLEDLWRLVEEKRRQARQGDDRKPEETQ